MRDVDPLDLVDLAHEPVQRVLAHWRELHAAVLLVLLLHPSDDAVQVVDDGARGFHPRADDVEVAPHRLAHPDGEVALRHSGQRAPGLGVEGSRNSPAPTSIPPISGLYPSRPGSDRS